MDAPLTEPAKKRLVAGLSLLLATLVWGTTFVVVKEALFILPPFTFIALRFTLGTLVMVPVCGRRLVRLSRRDVLAGGLVGTFLFAGFAFQTLGLQVAGATTSAFITSLALVLVPIGAWLWLRHRPSLGTVLGIAVATAGLGLLSLRDDLTLGSGDVLVLLCAIAFAMHIVAVGKYASAMDSLALTTIQLGLVAVLSWGFALVGEAPLSALPWASFGSLLYVGIIATAVVFAIQNVAQRFVTPTHAALIFTLEPVFAALFAVLWLGELLTSRFAAGASLILAGMLLATLGASLGLRMRSRGASAMGTRATPAPGTPADV